MKKKLWILSFVMAIMFMMAGANSALALPFGVDNGAGLQGVFDNITTTGPSSVNVVTDMVGDGSDSYWMIGGSGASVSTIIIELAEFAANNTFGVFDKADKTNIVQIFDGASTTGSQASIGIELDGSVLKNFTDTGIDFASGNNFGFYLDTTVNTGQIWYSDTTLNNDLWDHMFAYEGVGDTVQIASFAAGPWQSNEYILAFEDLPLQWPSDLDYTDFVVMVESISPASVPVPSALLLLSSGLVGFIGFRRKFRS